MIVERRGDAATVVCSSRKSRSSADAMLVGECGESGELLRVRRSAERKWACVPGQV